MSRLTQIYVTLRPEVVAILAASPAAFIGHSLRARHKDGTEILVTHEDKGMGRPCYRRAALAGSELETFVGFTSYFRFERNGAVIEDYSMVDRAAAGRFGDVREFRLMRDLEVLDNLGVDVASLELD